MQEIVALFSSESPIFPSIRAKTSLRQGSGSARHPFAKLSTPCHQVISLMRSRYQLHLPGRMGSLFLGKKKKEESEDNSIPFLHSKKGRTKSRNGIPGNGGIPFLSCKKVRTESGNGIPGDNNIPFPRCKKGQTERRNRIYRDNGIPFPHCKKG